MNPGLRPIDKARNWLARAIGQAAQRGASRLPTLMCAASAAGVSHVTMMRAVHELREQGVLSVKNRAGIVVRKPDGAPPVRPRACPVFMPKWGAVAERIGRDIESGLLPTDTPLPLCKTLAHRYGTSAETLRAALQLLVDERMLVRHKRGYRVYQADAAGPGRFVVFVARGRSAIELQNLPPVSFRNVTDLESECRRAQLGLATVPCYFVKSRMHGVDKVSDLLSHDRSRNRIAGVVVQSLGLTAECCAELAACLKPSGLPCAVLVDPASYQWREIRGTALFRYFRAENSRVSGCILGEYLHALGHRRIAFVHKPGPPEYSRLRCQGLSDALARSGEYQSGPGVLEVLPSEPIEAPDEPPFVLYRVGSDPDSNVETNAVLYGRLSELQSGIQGARPWRRFRDTLFGQLDQVLRGRQITAMVGAGDDVALDCLDYLRSRSLRVPDDISLAGFDNSQPAGLHRLTSYDFNYAAYIHMMVDFLLRPSWRHWTKRTESPIELEGFVVPRQTTAGVSRTG